MTSRGGGCDAAVLGAARAAYGTVTTSAEQGARSTAL